MCVCVCVHLSKVFKVRVPTDVVVQKVPIVVLTSDGKLTGRRLEILLLCTAQLIGIHPRTGLLRRPMDIESGILQFNHTNTWFHLFSDAGSFGLKKVFFGRGNTHTQTWHLVASISRNSNCVTFDPW